MRKFIFGSFIYNYWLVRQDRKTLSLTVTPDLQIIVKAPLKVTPERVEGFLKKKWFWLEQQLNFFKKYQRTMYQREYISGESFWYLGRQYELLVKRSSENKVTLTKGKIIVSSKKSVSDGLSNRKLIEEWYKRRIAGVFIERFEQVGNRFDYSPRPKLIVREMKTRWGSFLNKDKIFLNPKLIYTSKDCIDYVISHELCHLQYKNHDRKFFFMLKKNIPNWKKVKEKLERYPI